MAIVIESTSSGSSATTSLTLTKPTGTVENDLLVAFIQLSRDSPVDTPPAGWTKREGGGSYSTYHSWYKVAGASEPANYTWSETGENAWYGIIFRVSGVDPVNPLNTSSYGEDTDYDTSFTVTGVTTSVDACLVFAAAWKSGRYMTAVSGGWTSDYLTPGTPGLGVAHKTQATAGATGNAVFTANSGDRSAYVMFAFQPATGVTVKPMNYFSQL